MPILFWTGIDVFLFWDWQDRGRVFGQESRHIKPVPFSTFSQWAHLREESDSKRQQPGTCQAASVSFHGDNNLDCLTNWILNIRSCASLFSRSIWFPCFASPPTAVRQLGVLLRIFRFLFPEDSGRYRYPKKSVKIMHRI